MDVSKSDSFNTINSTIKFLKKKDKFLKQKLSKLGPILYNVWWKLKPVEH